MNHHSLREVAKFAAGLVTADFLTVLWFSMSGRAAMSFMGIHVTADMIAPTLVFDAALVIILIHYGWHIGRAPLLRERTFLLVAGVFFGIVAIAHLVRIFTGADISLMGWDAPLWLSWIGTAVTSYLSYMSFHLALRMR